MTTLDDLSKAITTRKGIMLQLRYRGGEFQAIVRRRTNGAGNREVVSTLRGPDLSKLLEQVLHVADVLYESETQSTPTS